MTDRRKAENVVEPEAGARLTRRETMITGGALAAGAVLAGCQSTRPAAAASPQPRITGKRSVEDARRFYAKTAKAFKAGEKDPYTQRLLFEMRKGGTADPDEEMM